MLIAKQVGKLSRCRSCYILKGLNTNLLYYGNTILEGGVDPPSGNKRPE
jgi:hypothetical protein